MTEEWRYIPGYVGAYKASDKGRVRSVNRTINHPQGPMRRKGIIMKQRIVKGYQMVCLTKNGKSEHMTVHKAVLLAFPSGHGDQSRHLDGNCLNNYATNLTWGTATENAQDRKDHGTWTHGVKHARSIINNGTVRLIRSLHRMGYGPTEISYLVNWRKSCVHGVISGHTWKHV